MKMSREHFNLEGHCGVSVEVVEVEYDEYRDIGVHVHIEDDCTHNFFITSAETASECFNELANRWEAMAKLFRARAVKVS